MADIDQDDARAALVQTLIQKVKADTYPSTTMLDMIEELLTDQEIPAYVVLLQDKLRDDTYPSIPMLDRLRRLVQPA